MIGNINFGDTYIDDYIDTVSPMITVSSESSGVLIDGTAYYNKPVTITATDNYSDVNNLIVTLNGLPYVLGTEITENGTYTVTVTDEAGNRSFVNFVINIQVTSLPNIVLTSVANMVETETMKYYKGAVSYEITNANSIVLTKDGTVVSVSENTVNSDGVYLLTVTSETGDKVSESFTIDTKGPIISGVAHGRQYRNESLEVTIQDLSPIIATYRHNNSEAISFENSIVLTEEGRYTISAKDILGNVPLDRETITFIIDRTAPTISGVTNGQTYNRNVTITFKDEQLAQNRLTATLTKPDGSKETFVSGTTLSENGKYTLVVKDVAGNTNTVTFTISK